jgi:hypothetical protein
MNKNEGEIVSEVFKNKKIFKNLLSDYELVYTDTDSVLVKAKQEEVEGKY